MCVYPTASLFTARVSKPTGGAVLADRSGSRSGASSRRHRFAFFVKCDVAKGFLSFPRGDDRACSEELLERHRRAQFELSTSYTHSRATYTRSTTHSVEKFNARIPNTVVGRWLPPTTGRDLRFVSDDVSRSFPSPIWTIDRSNDVKHVSCGFPEHSQSSSHETRLDHSQTRTEVLIESPRPAGPTRRSSRAISRTRASWCRTRARAFSPWPTRASTPTPRSPLTQKPRSTRAPSFSSQSLFRCYKGVSFDDSRLFRHALERVRMRGFSGVLHGTIKVRGSVKTLWRELSLSLFRLSSVSLALLDVSSRFRGP